jgi:hypothetical protein
VGALAAMRHRKSKHHQSKWFWNIFKIAILKAIGILLSMQKVNGKLARLVRNASSNFVPDRRT